MKPKLFFRSHKKKIVAGAPIIFLLLLGSSGVLSGVNILSLDTSESIFISVNDEIPVTLSLSTKTAVNAAGGTVNFPPTLLSVSSIARTSSVIDLWSEEPVTSNETGTIRFSGGIVGPHVSTTGNSGTVLVIFMRALKEGKAVMQIKDGELLANDGGGANVISSTKSLALYIRSSEKTSPDVNGDGELTLMDINSLYLKTFRDYDARYDINNDNEVDWSDVRALISLL